MTTYVSMLRGINVGGAKRIAMPKLASLYEALGFEAVRTYIQSGNVIFESADQNVVGIREAIEEKIRASLGVSVAVIIRTMEDLSQITVGNPFIARGMDAKKLHVTFLSDVPANASLASGEISRDGADEFYLTGKEIYLFCPDGYGRTKLSNSFFEKKLGVSATTRNWKTVNTLLALARHQS